MFSLSHEWADGPLDRALTRTYKMLRQFDVTNAMQSGAPHPGPLPEIRSLRKHFGDDNQAQQPQEKENDMKDCFGTIYPDLSQIQFGREIAGKVFRLKIDTVGPFHRERQLEIDVRAWEDCQKCEMYRSCYDFSTGKLLMQQFMVQI